MKAIYKKTIFLIGDIVLFLIIFVLAFYLFFEKHFDNKIYPNVYFDDLNLGGLTVEEARVVLQDRVDNFDTQSIRLVSDSKEVLWNRTFSSFDPDLSVQSVFFDINKTVDQAFLLGRSDVVVSDFYFKATSFFRHNKIPLSFLIDKKEVKYYLNSSFESLVSPTMNANIISNQSDNFYNFPQVKMIRDFKEEVGTTTDEIVFLVYPETYGQQIDYDHFFSELESNLSRLSTAPIEIKFTSAIPEIKLTDIDDISDIVYNSLHLAPFDLFYKHEQEEVVFTVSPEDFSLWLELVKVGDELQIGLNSEEVFKFLETKIAPEIERDIVKPQFEFKDDKVSLFSPGVDGLKIDQEKTLKDIRDAFQAQDFSSVSLLVEIAETDDLGDTNDFGIKELIGSGHSNFAGSSANRRHNIRVGSEKLSGLIIKPEEEFSLVKALGPTEARDGYLPELVIKGNKTVPEYGGGLCQVATTMFRAALGTGLPITERRNHSYRVSYYEPAGTDATIYIPHPDLRFKNDTGNNILIQVRFEGDNDMYFDFWGTSDGRLATTTTPVIYNIVSPPPTQIIETTDLKPGQKVCTESAHSGADTYFDYFVTYNPGTEEEKKVENRFYSKYVPWRAVCLLGVEPRGEDDVAIDQGGESAE